MSQCSNESSRVCVCHILLKNAQRKRQTTVISSLIIFSHGLLSSCIDLYRLVSTCVSLDQFASSAVCLPASKTSADNIASLYNYYDIVQLYLHIVAGASVLKSVLKFCTSLSQSMHTSIAYVSIITSASICRTFYLLYQVLYLDARM